MRVLDASISPTLLSVSEDSGGPVGPVGTPVANLVDLTSFVGGLNNVTDVDSGALTGIAIIGSSASGTWFYTIDNGQTWSPFSDVSDASALLLAADPGNRLYFQPAANLSGAIDPAITFRAWDRSNGLPAGSRAPSVPTGGTTAYSTAIETASIVISPVNNAPLLDTRASPTLLPINEDAPAPVGPVGTPVANLVDLASIAGGLDNVGDVDAAALLGVAIIESSANGTWFYTVNNGQTWSPFSGVSDSSALLLAAEPSNRLYFQPAPNLSGIIDPAITFRAWDRSNGLSPGGRAPSVPNGGTTAYSTATDTASIVVNPANDPPTATNLSAAETYLEDTPLNLIDIVVADLDSATVTATLTLSNPAAGTLSTATSGGVTSTFWAGVWTALGPVANVNSLLAGVTFIPAPNFNGNFNIITSVSDGIATVGGSKAIIGIAVNDPPVAMPGVAYVHNDIPTILSVLANATGGPIDENQTLTLTAIDGVPIAVGDTRAVAHGAVTLNAGGTLSYVPEPGYVGAETFTYTVCDTGSPVLCAPGSVALTVLPPTTVTDGSLCMFDAAGVASDSRQFRAIFTQRPNNSNYKLGTSNPGEFSYNLFYIGAPGPQQFAVTIPYPFATREATSVRAYDGVSVANNVLGQPCFVPGNPLPVDNWQVTLADYDFNSDGLPDVTSDSTIFDVIVPATGFFYFNISLDYGLKSTGSYGKGSPTSPTDAVIPGTTTVAVPDGAIYTFYVDGALAHQTTVQSVNAFKPQPGFGGLVVMGNACGSNPVPGRIVTISNSNGKLIGAATTDADGWYNYAYQHKAKSATYTIKLLGQDGITVDQSQTVTVQVNGSAEVGFTVACPAPTSQ